MDSHLLGIHEQGKRRPHILLFFIIPASELESKKPVRREQKGKKKNRHYRAGRAAAEGGKRARTV